VAYPRIISVSTANPPHRFTQEETLLMAGDREILMSLGPGFAAEGLFLVW